jgi:hypothetical protein
MNIIVAYILIVIAAVIFSVGIFYIANASAKCITKDGEMQPDNRDSNKIGGSFGVILGVFFLIAGVGIGVTSK